NRRSVHVLLEAEQFFIFVDEWSEGQDPLLDRAYVLNRILPHNLGVEAEAITDRTLLTEIERLLDHRLVRYD
ncbi:MAG: hypothetical protein AABY10_02395, partial [Nanoarchaeota archaeon]